MATAMTAITIVVATGMAATVVAPKSTQSTARIVCAGTRPKRAHALAYLSTTPHARSNTSLVLRQYGSHNSAVHTSAPPSAIVPILTTGTLGAGYSPRDVVN